MQLRSIRLHAALLALVLMTACATSQIQKARTVSVDIHAALAAVDDAERALFQSGTVPTWTAEKHQKFSAQLVIALKAGRALNEGVRVTPVSTGAKANLATVSTALEDLTKIVADTLPPGSPLVVTLTAAKDAALSLLPLFLE